jgi:hypothetical protein
MMLAALLLLATANVANPASEPGPPAAAPASGFQGRYAMEMKVATYTWVPIYGDVNSVTFTHGYLDIVEEAGVLMATQHVCEVHIEGDAPFGVSAQIPPSFVRALRVKRFALTRADTPTGPSATFIADLGVETIGFNGPARGPVTLPKKSDDPSIIDADRDGRPGTTVMVSLPFGRFKLGVVSIGESKLIGRIIDDTRAVGNVKILRQEQRVVSSDLPFVPDDIGSAKPLYDKSTFELRRMKPDATCADVVPTIKLKLPPAPPASPPPPPAQPSPVKPEASRRDATSASTLAWPPLRSRSSTRASSLCQRRWPFTFVNWVVSLRSTSKRSGRRRSTSLTSLTP